MNHDNVNHPRHYTSHPSGVECITITEHMTFNVGNAVKYLWRAGIKVEHRKRLEATLEDLQKAQWYVSREIGRVSAEMEEEAHRETVKTMLRDRKKAEELKAQDVQKRLETGTETASEMEGRV